jgi:murein L,D-transpeptidase YafK
MLALVLMLTASFKDDQLKLARVRAAQKNVEQTLRDRFAEKQLAYPPRAIFLRVFKQEKTFEVWVQKEASWVLLHSYPICASSGQLGPKLQEGDGQVPEGVYTIDHFNPSSNYHLALRVAYPNAADRIRTAALAKAQNIKMPAMGGDIYVHGNCVTIGCMPLTDPLIEEVYWLAVLAKDAGQRAIPIHIFPMRLDDGASLTHDVWKQLQPIYAAFESTHTLPVVTIDKAGAYVLGK